MKILDVEVKNFQSYEHLSFNYADLGPTLIAGPTKVGKSTLLDAPCWIAYGRTSKGSAADDVRSWFSGDEETSGTMRIDLGDRIMTIYRKRGKRSSQNDLWYDFGGDEKIRGKDAVDTQLMIWRELRVKDGLYLTGSYIHQFSSSDTFFIAKAKDRREIIESIKDLTKPIAMAEQAANLKKSLKKDVETAESKVVRTRALIESAESEVERNRESLERWDRDQVERHHVLTLKADTFQAELNREMEGYLGKLEVLNKDVAGDPQRYSKQVQEVREQVETAEVLLKELNDHERSVSRIKTELSFVTKQITSHTQSSTGVCPTCLGPADNDTKRATIAQLKKDKAGLEAELKPHEARCLELSEVPEIRQKLLQDIIELNKKQAELDRKKDQFDALKIQAQSIRQRKNTYKDQAEQLKAEKNPFEPRLKTSIASVISSRTELKKLETSLDTIKQKLFAADWLYDASFRIKASMLHQAVSDLQDRTNEILETYFDAEIQVAFKIEDSDKIEVTITNEGYECPFRQLSGGERCMLKLAFNVAYMEAAQNCAGVKIDTVMLDEALNGLDADLKVKAYNLVEYLGTIYSSVIVIEHSEEFKTLFPTVFKVSKEGSRSQVEQVV